MEGQQFNRLKWTIARFRRHRMAFWSAIFLLLLSFSVILASLSPYDARRHSVMEKFQSPSLAHPFGTDALGRDVLTRLLYGGRYSLVTAIVATSISLAIGLPVGLTAGYAARRLDSLLMRLVDVFLSIPPLFALIIISTLLQKTNITALYAGQPMIVAATIGVLSWMTIARLVRSLVLSLRNREFVIASRALGSGSYRIIGVHIFPHTMPVIIIEATLLLAASITIETGLSFIGFGIDPATPSWGNMLREGQAFISQYPWLSLFPGILVSLTIVAINFVGDGLRDLLDPWQSTSNLSQGHALASAFRLPEEQR